MSNRRNPFDAAAQTDLACNPPGIYEAPRKRRRQWEKEHLSHKAVYRGVDPKLALKVKAIAQELFVPAGEVACALIGYALRAYAVGDLSLNPRHQPYRMRMTLFPSSEAFIKYEAAARPKGGKHSAALWRVIVTWRNFQPELKQEISALASEDGLNVPLGELVSALLRFGLTAYRSDLVKLEPVQKSTSYTLKLTGPKKFVDGELDGARSRSGPGAVHDPPALRPRNRPSSRLRRKKMPGRQSLLESKK